MGELKLEDGAAIEKLLMEQLGPLETEVEDVDAGGIADEISFHSYWDKKGPQDDYEGGPIFYFAVHEMMENAVIHGSGVARLMMQKRQRGKAALMTQRKEVTPEYNAFATLAMHVAESGPEAIWNYVTEIGGRLGMVLMHKLKDVTVGAKGCTIVIYRPYTVQDA